MNNITSAIRYSLIKRMVKIITLLIALWIIPNGTIQAQTVDKPLYLTDPGTGLDRIKPSGADATQTSSTLTVRGGSQTYLDNFSTQAFNNTNGTINWSATPWVETDAGGAGATAGNIQVTTAGYLTVTANNTDNIYRPVNLSGASSATLTYNVITIGMQNAGHGTINVEVYNGSTYRTVETITSTSTTTNARSFTIAAGELNANFRVRINGIDGNAAKTVTFDNFQIAATYSGVSTLTFTQGTAMCSNLSMPTGGAVSVTAYANVTSGTLPATPAISAILRYTGTPTVFATLVSPTWSSGAGTLTWTGTLGSTVNVPAGSSIELVITTSEPAADFSLRYNSTTYPSKIDLPTTTPINIDSYAVYNAAFSGGSIITSAFTGNTVYTRATVSDPFGFSDITGLDLQITTPLGGVSTITASSVATSGCTRTYEYAWTTPSNIAGNYSLRFTAKEGTEATVTNVKTLPFTLKTSSALTVTKTLTSPATAPYTINTNLSYNVAIKNTGTINITTLPLQDLFNTDCLQFVSAVPAQNSVAGGNISWTNLGTLTPGSTTNVTVNFKVIGNCDPTTNTATVSGAIDVNGYLVPTGTFSSAVSINIDQPPVANPDQFCVSGVTSLNVLANDTDPDGSFGTVTITSAPSANYTLSVNVDKTIQFTPVGSLADNQLLTFTYKVADSNYPSTYSSSATASVFYSNVNNPPSLTDDLVQTSVNLPVAISVLSNDTDWDGSLDPSTLTVSTPPTYGTATVNSNGTINYSPNPDFIGTDIFYYKIYDTGCPSPTQFSIAKVTVKVIFAEYACSLGTNTLSVPSVPGAVGYVWHLPAGATVTSTYTGTLPDPHTILPNITVVWSAGVSPGTYEIGVTPANDCGPGTTQTVKMVVTHVTLTATPTDILCYGSKSGAINLAVNSGIAPYTYSWTGPNGYTASIGNISALAPGTYNVTVTDANGCMGTISAAINEPASAISISGSVTNENPYGASNGAITITTGGGSPGYSYLWSNSATSQNLTNIAGGTYTVTATDNNGCNATHIFTVDRIGGPLEVSLIAGTNVRCNGGSTGSVNLEVIGGTSPYTYAWTASTGITATTQDLSAITAGTYNVTITDNASPKATATSSITITQPAVLAASASFINNLCNGNSNGSITLTTPTGGTTPYTYLWSNGATSQNLTGLKAGTYSVTVSDANGCTLPLSETISQPAPLTLSAVVVESNCNPVVPADYGTITITPGGGTPFSGPAAYHYQWSNGAITQNVSGLSTGTYSVTVTDANGCQKIGTYVIESACLGTAKNVAATPVNNGDGTYTLSYDIRVENKGTVSLQGIQVVENLMTTFASATGFSVNSVIMISQPSSNSWSLNNSFDGNVSANLLSSTGSLQAGEFAMIRVTSTVTPGATLTYNNTSVASGQSAAGKLVSDNSHNGADVDPDGNGNPGDNSDPTPITFAESPGIGLAKTISSTPVNNTNGTYTLSYQLKVQNVGNVLLHNVQVADNLTTTFPGLILTGVSASIANQPPGTTLTINSSYNGSSNINLLSGTNTLKPGEYGIIQVTFTVALNGSLGPFNNSAGSSATSPAGIAVSDISQDGTNVDPNNNGPGDNSDPTPVTFTENPIIGLAKVLYGTPVNNNDGTWSLKYRLRIQNMGNVPFIGVQATDHLATTFAGLTLSSVSVSVVSQPASTTLTANGSYNGSSNINLLNESNTLHSGEYAILEISLTVQLSEILGPYNNNAAVSGTGSGGTVVTDNSVDGTLVDPDGDGNPNNDTSPTPVTFTENPQIGIAKSVGTPVNNHNGTYTVDYTFKIANTGTSPLHNVQATDNLVTAFSGATGFTINSVTSSTFTVNYPGYNGNSVLTLLSGSDLLAVGASGTVIISVTITPGTKLGVYDNSAIATGTGLGGTIVTDNSVNGTNVDPDGDGNPNNNNSLTPLTLTESPQIGLAKTIINGPVNNGNGTYTLTYQIRIQNYGNVPLSNVQAIENLSQTFVAASSISGVSAIIQQQPTSTTLVLNSSYNGSSNANLLNGTGSLLYGEYALLRVTVTVTPGGVGGPYDNSAVGTAQSPGGRYVFDSSQDGTSVDPDNNGLATDDNVPTPVSFSNNPKIGLAKSLVSVVDNHDLTNTVTFLFRIENFGDIAINNLKIYDDIITQFSTVSPTNFSASEGTLFANGSWDGTATSNILVEGQSLAIGAVETVSVSFKVTPGATLSLNNNGTAEGTSAAGTTVTDRSTDGTDPDGTDNDNNPDELVPTPVPFVVPVDLAITKISIPTTYTPGQNVSWTITVTNAGPGNATGAKINDLVNSSLTGVSWIATPHGSASVTHSSGSGSIIDELVTITSGSGNNIIYTVTATVPASFTGNLVNTTTVTAPDGITDNDLTNNTSTNILSSNIPPVAIDHTNAAIPSSAGATAIDPLTATDADGSIASYTVVTLPTHGTLYLGASTVTEGQVLTPAEALTLKYDPDGTFTGNDTFKFTATDNLGAVDATPATVTIPVGNNPPVAIDHTNAAIPSSAGATAIDPLTATDADGSVASYTVVTLPTHGTLYLGASTVTEGQVLTPAEALTLKYDPDGTFTGNDTFKFTATDNLGAVDATPATVTIPVGNNPPVAIDHTNAAIPSSAGATAIDPLTATDADGSIASFTVVSLPAHGTLYLGASTVTEGQVLTPAEALTLKYDPDGTFTGNDTFTFTATDNLGAVDATPATVTIPVGNNPPVAIDHTNAAIPSSAGATAIDPLTATDADGSIASYTVVSLPTHGTLYLGASTVTEGQVLTPAEALTLKYDPDGTFTGNDTFTFTATDNLGAVDATPATVTIPVLCADIPAPIVSETLPTCASPNGTVAVTSVTTGLTYSINGSAYAAYSAPYTVAAGASYSITAKNTDGCISAAVTGTMAVQPGTPDKPTVSETLPTCASPNGTVAVTSVTTGLTYSINGSAYAAYSAAYTVAAGASYSITAKNTDGCISAAVTGTMAAQPGTPDKPTVSETLPTCASPNGTVAITSVTTGLTYSINGSPYAAYSAAYTVAAGASYSITAKNTDGCISAAVTGTMAAQPGTPDKPTVSETLPTCASPNGTVAITSVTTGLTYSINGSAYAAYSAAYTVAAGASYSITAKNTDGCISAAVTGTMAAQPGTPDKPAVSETLPTCASPNGTVAVTSVTTGLTFSINGSPYAAYSAPYTVAAGASYSITAKNTDGCISAAVTGTMAVQPGTPDKPTVSETLPTCASPNGTVAVTSVTTGLTFSINGSAYAAYSAPYTVAAGASYSITAKNTDGCISAAVTGTMAVQPGTPDKPTVSETLPTCASPNGTVAVTSVTTGLTYSINGSAYAAYSAPYTVAAGASYSITAKNTDGCISAAVTGTMAAQPGTPDKPTVSETLPTCASPNGTVAVTSVTTGLTFSINGSAYAAYSAAYTVAAGASYSITAKNTDGCISAAVTGTMAAQPGTPDKPTVSETLPTCASPNGTVAVTSVTTGLTYSINGSPYATYSAAYTVAAGASYSITAKNTDGCISAAVTGTMAAQPGTPDKPTVSETLPTCASPNGTVAVTSVTTGLTYSINGSPYVAYSAAYTVAAGASYSITAKNTDGCISAAVTGTMAAQPGTPDKPTVSETLPTCASPNGTVAVTSVTTGLTFSINGSAYAAYSAAYTVAAGASYSITAKNTDGCISAAVTGTMAAQPGTPDKPTVSETLPTCASPNGTVAVTSVTTGLTYSINGSPYAAYSAAYTVAAGASYSITAKNTDGCISAAVTGTMAAQPGTPDKPTVSETLPTCASPNGTVAITSVTTGLTYSINGSAYAAYSAAYTVAAGASYSITAKNTDGCISAAVTGTMAAQPGTPDKPAVSETLPTCASPNGTVAVTSVTTGLTFSINGSPYAAYSAPYTVAAGASYSITAKNTDGCISAAVTGTMAVQPGTPDKPTVSETLPTCASPNGTVAVTSVTTGLTFSINGSAYAAYSAPYTVAAGASYSITAKNTDGCISAAVTGTMAAQPGTPDKPTVSETLPTCASPNGTVAVTSVTTGLTYSINGSAYAAYSAPYTVAAGASYSITAKNTDGCISAAVTGTMAAQPGTPDKPTVSETLPTCASPNGTVAVTSVTTGLTFSINGSAYAAYSAAYTVAAGASYSITAKNTDGCISAAVTGTMAAQPGTPDKPTVSETLPTCASPNGTVAVTSVTTGLTYSINGSPYAAYSAAYTVAAGASYSITAKNTDGCISAAVTGTMAAQPGTPDKPTVSETLPTCASPNGTVAITSVTTGLTYSINGSAYAAYSAPYTVAAGASYSITAKNTDGCISAAVTGTMAAQPGTPDKPTVSETLPTCASPNGTVAVTSVTTGLTFSINGSAYAAYSAAYTVAAGASYSITAKNTDGCISAAVTGTMAAQPGTPDKPTVSETLPTCASPNGTVAITSVTTGLTYSINGSPYAAYSAPYTVAAGASYSITAKNTDGCISAAVTGTMAAQPGTPDKPAVSETLPTCASPNGTVAVTSVTTGLTFSINGSAYAAYSAAYTVAAGASYSITAKNTDGCISAAVTGTMAAQPGTPDKPTVSETLPTCASPNGTVAVTSVTTGLTYSINGSPYAAYSAAYTVAAGASYSITAKNTDGCISAAVTGTMAAQPGTPDKPTVSETLPTCASPNGTVAITSVTTGLTFSINGSPYAAYSAPYTVAAGASYSITAKNTDGCISAAVTGTMAVQPGTPDKPTVSETLPTCASPNGTVAVTSVTTGLTFSINGSAYAAYSAAYTVAAGASYSITAKNTDGCISAAVTGTMAAQPGTPDKPAVSETLPTCASPNGTVAVTSVTTGLTFSINGSAYAAYSAAYTVAAGASYSITAKNTDGCISAAVTGTMAAQPGTPDKPTVSETLPTCASPNGTVAVTSVTTGLTYSINGSAYAAYSAAYTVAAGASYSITAKNTDGCISAAVTGTMAAQPGTPDKPTATITQPTCAIATGSVILNGLPATGTWTLTRSPGAVTSTGTGTSTTITSLATGSYTYTVQNTTGCTSPASDNIVINAQPPTPTPPVVSARTQPTCAVATGRVILNGLPATGTWTLTRSPGAVTSTGTGTTATISGLVAGTYTYTVTNATGCISTASVNIVINTQPATPTPPVVGARTQPTCGVATGSVVLSGLPATGTWTLTRSPGAVTSTGTGTARTITGIAAGAYTYTVTNATGCISTASASVVINAQPATPTPPVVGSRTQPTCALATGSVVLSGLPATGTWTLTRSPGAVTSTGTGATTTIPALAAGSYTYIVTNAVGCTSSASANVVINAQPATPTVPTVGTITQPTCATATGSVIISGLPATGTWTLTRSPGAITSTGTGTTATISALAAGTYSYTVTNSVGCTSAASANVVINAQPATPIVPTVGTITQPTCATATGSVIISGLPATGSWTLTRTPGGVTTTGTGISTTISALAAGTYSYTVTNSVGCTSAASANVVINAQPATPTAPTVGTITQPTCATATGRVILSGLPATGSWTLTRSPGAVTSTGTGTTTTITGLATGIYTYTVTNAVGCTSSASANVVINAQPATPTAPTVGTITQPTCATATGRVILSGLPATGTWTLTRTPGGVTTTGIGISTTISALAAGSYSYTVTNGVGCTSSASENVVINAQPDTPTAPTVGKITQPACSSSTGTITLSGPTGSGLTYSIDGITYTNTNGIFTEVPSGTYQVTVKNSNGCTSLGISVTINPAPPVLALTKAVVTTPIVCYGGTATVTLYTSGGTAPITYTLNGVKNSSGVFNGVLAGNALTYNITDANQCGPLTGTIDVIQPPAITLDALPANVTCKGAANGTINLTVSNGKAPFTYTWTGPGSFSATTEDLSGLSGGTYNVTVSDANGCTKTTSTTVEESGALLSLTTLPKMATKSMSINGSNILGTTGGSIDLTVSGGTAPFTYSWSGQNAFTASTKDLTDLSGGIYTVTVSDAYGCSTTASAEVKVQVVLSEDATCEILVPNSFSPNGDGINDYFKVNCLYNYENPIIEIYNRWGNLVFKKDHYGDVDFWGSETDAWWNGRSENKLTIGSQDLPVGTYYYILKLNKIRILTGFLFLNK